MKHTGNDRACPACGDIDGCHYRLTDHHMNLLQLHTTIISDNCVHWSDVSEVDQDRAIEWLKSKGKL